MHKTDIFLKKENEYQPNNIIFLDIDGVIQPYNSQKRFDHDMQATINHLAIKYQNDIYKNMNIYDVNASFYDWNYLAIGILHEMLEKYHAEIVLSSEWRKFHSLESIKALFKIYDLHYYIKDLCKGNFEEEIKTNNIVSKEEAIKDYLNTHLVDNYLVIDDYDMTSSFGQNFRRTSNTLKVSDINYAALAFRNNITIKKDDNYICLFLNPNYKEDAYLKYEYQTNNTLKLRLDYLTELKYGGKEILEYLINNIYKKENVDKIYLDMNDLRIEDLNIPGYLNDKNTYVLTKKKY